MNDSRLLGAATLARTLALALCVVACSDSFSQPTAAASGASTAPRVEFKQIRWDDLVPPGWDPYAGLRDNSLGVIMDGTPRAKQRMQAMQDIWDNAPTNPEMNGQSIKLAGYIVPIEESKAGMKEFLLVPYFGACIHSPPPPANQIVHVVMTKPVKGYSAMDTAWVRGTLKTARQDSGMGVSGYRIDAVALDRYVPAMR
jgi:hypothetical protein